MRRVSFEVAKALKETGYPQGVLPGIHKVKSFPMFYNGDFVPDYDYFFANYITIFEPNLCIACPTYIEVWLWLWREKKIYINTGITNGYTFAVVSSSTSETGRIVKLDEDFYAQDPEDAIIKAIKYIVEHNLIK